MGEYTIEHNVEKQEFTINLDADDVATLKYTLDDDSNGLDICSTFVPDNYRGKNIAGKLVDAAVEYSQQQERNLQTSCWYAELRVKRQH